MLSNQNMHDSTCVIISPSSTLNISSSILTEFQDTIYLSGYSDSGFNSVACLARPQVLVQPVNRSNGCCFIVEFLLG